MNNNLSQSPADKDWDFDAAEDTYYYKCTFDKISEDGTLESGVCWLSGLSGKERKDLLEDLDS